MAINSRRTEGRDLKPRSSIPSIPTVAHKRQRRASSRSAPWSKREDRNHLTGSSRFVACKDWRDFTNGVSGKATKVGPSPPRGRSMPSFFFHSPRTPAPGETLSFQKGRAQYLEKSFRSERSEVWSSRLAGGQEIAGSNPAVLTSNRTPSRELTNLAQGLERQSRKLKVTGSTPVVNHPRFWN